MASSRASLLLIAVLVAGTVGLSGLARDTGSGNVHSTGVWSARAAENGEPDGTPADDTPLIPPPRPRVAFEGSAPDEGASDEEPTGDGAAGGRWRGGEGGTPDAPADREGKGDADEDAFTPGGDEAGAEDEGAPTQPDEGGTTVPGAPEEDPDEDPAAPESPDNPDGAADEPGTSLHVEVTGWARVALLLRATLGWG